MGTTTNIAWTDKTYNPWIGCGFVTEAECGDCYAKRWAHRHRLNVWGPLYQSERHLTKTGRDPYIWNAQAKAEGRRFKVFCASLADVFEPHPQVAEARQRLWETIEATPYLDWQLLTKRPKFIRQLVPQSWLRDWPTHVWVGTSVGTQAAAHKRIPYLLDLPAPIKFLSCEPLVEQITLAPWLTTGLLTWVICGGYSGSQNRPMDLAWARALQDESVASGVKFFMKQLGTVYAKAHDLGNWKGEDPTEFPADLQVQEVPQTPDQRPLHPATFELLVTEYFCRVMDQPTNTEYSQIHNTLKHYAPDIHTVIKVVHDLSRELLASMQKYPHEAHIFGNKLAYLAEFLERVREVSAYLHNRPGATQHDGSGNFLLSGPRGVVMDGMMEARR